MVLVKSLVLEVLTEALLADGPLTIVWFAHRAVYATRKVVSRLNVLVDFIAHLDQKSPHRVLLVHMEAWLACHHLNFARHVPEVSFAMQLEPGHQQDRVMLVMFAMGPHLHRILKMESLEKHVLLEDSALLALRSPFLALQELSTT
jgi:hypothetical protein